MEPTAAERLESAYQDHFGRLLGLAAGMAGNWSLAEDIVQDVFASLLKHPKSVDEEHRALVSQLVVRSRSRAIDLHRNEQARRRNENRNFSAGADPRHALEEEAALVNGWDLRNALRQLPDDELQPVLLAFFGGKSYREVAVTLGIPEGTAKARIRLALRHLRATLGNDIVDW